MNSKRLTSPIWYQRGGFTKGTFDLWVMAAKESTAKTPSEIVITKSKD
jgi:hypothetical protein